MRPPGAPDQLEQRARAHATERRRLPVGAAPVPGSSPACAAGLRTTAAVALGSAWAAGRAGRRVDRPATTAESSPERYLRGELGIGPPFQAVWVSAFFRWLQGPAITDIE